MKSFATRVSIDAGATTVWRILTDAATYPKWNTTVSRVGGRIVLGEKITVHVVASPGRAFPVTVVELTPPSRMVWTGGMPLGLFTGERVYEVTSNGANRVEFSMREEYTGLLAGMITKSIPNLQPAFDEFAACLKARAERG